MVINSSDKSLFEIRDSTGKEFKEIYDNQDRLLFKNWNEIQGSPPITFRGYGKNLTECRIYGNTVQNGTPSPEAPVDVVGCGERTENLFDGEIIAGVINAETGVYDKYSYSYICSENPTAVLGETTVTLSIKNHSYTGALYIIEYDENHNFLKGSGTNVISNPVLTTTLGENTRFVHVEIENSRDNPSVEKIGGFQLEYGNVATEYEPYGYKIPVTVSNGTNSITTPVYIGSEPLHKIGDYADYVDYKRGVVVRRIKKLVLTGKENWYASGSWGKENTAVYYMTSTGGYSPSASVVYVFCDHYSAASRNELYNNDSECAGFTGVASLTFRVSRQYAGTKADFVSYLAAQYAAGTPVTVWYVLAEPEEEPMENLLPIQTIKGTNSLTADTTVQPSEMYLKGKIKPVT